MKRFPQRKMGTWVPFTIVVGIVTTKVGGTFHHLYVAEDVAHALVKRGEIICRWAVMGFKGTLDDHTHAMEKKRFAKLDDALAFVERQFPRVQWVPYATLQNVVRRGKMYFSFSVVHHSNKFVVSVVATDQKPGTGTAVLDSHAHITLGQFDDLRAAMRACDKRKLPEIAEKCRCVADPTAVHGKARA